MNNVRTMSQPQMMSTWTSAPGGWTGHDVDLDARCVVYALSLDERDIRYVGITVNKLRGRFNNHKAMAIKDSPQAVHEWMRESGIENVKVHILSYVASRDELPLAEIWWIAELRSLGYALTNRTIGGDGVHGCVHTDEAKDRMRRSHSGKTLSPEHRAKIGKAVKGKTVSQETRAKLSTASKARWEKSRQNGETFVNCNPPVSDETRAKIRAGRAKQIIGPRSPETRAKIKASWNKRRAAKDGRDTP